MKTFKQPIRTRYSETAQDRIVHHTSYVVYLEVARLAFFKSIGVDIKALEKNSIYCPVIDLSVKYLKTLESLEDIEVHVTVGPSSKVRFSLDYQILHEEKCAATATTTHCFVNEAFKPIPIPKEIASAFNE